MADWWQDKPWRMIQTNLREIDMQDIRADQVVADLQEFRATVLMINAAGIIASYPTTLPFHYQSPYLQGDGLTSIIEACHGAGIRVFARTDFSKVRRSVYEQHPEWAYRTATGEIVDYNGDIAVCVNGEYQQEYALAILREVLTRHSFDGIFFNMGGFQTRDYHKRYYGICHCANCRRLFHAQFGQPLPTREEMDEPLFRDYLRFQTQCLRRHHERVYRFVHDLRPEMAIANHREFRRGFIRQESNTAVDRPLPHWQYSGSDNTKWAVSSYPTMMSSNTTVDFIDYPYRHVAVSPHQQRLRLAQNLANGGALDYYLIGRLDNHRDRSGFAAVQELFHYHAAQEAYYSRITSVADVALINGPYANQEEFRGWYRMLVEHHVRFDTILTDTALELPWQKYRAVIVPDYRPLGDSLAQHLDQFVARGGLLIACGESGFRDEGYAPREVPALACLGMRRILQVRRHMTGSYFQGLDHTLFPGMAQSELIYLDGSYVYGEYQPQAQAHLSLIPPQPFGPPERCYPEIESDHPGFVVHPFGTGRAVYLPWCPGALFHRQGHLNTTHFVGDLLLHVAGIPQIGDGLSPMVETTHFTHLDGAYDLVHLVNGSGHFGNSFFAPVPMHNLTVTVPLTWQPAQVRSLVRQEPCTWTWEDDNLTIQVPELALFEALLISRH